jgi:ABC-type phosphate transport system permease subunit
MLGTLKVTLIAMLIGTPLALGGALYVGVAPVRLREWIKPGIELLAGIPSVVMGFFALIVLASWLQARFGLEFRLNALNAGIALALAIIPIIYTVSEDALNAVPQSYREASLALGASKIQTAVRVVLPAAMPGIGAAMILGFGRAIGETMIVLMASGNAAYLSLSPLTSARTLSATIAAELGSCLWKWALSHPLLSWHPPVCGDFRPELGRRPLQSPDADEAFRVRMRKTIDRSVVILSGAATALILAMLGIILGNIVWHGTARLSFDFLTQAPAQGMTAGGIFPAIYEPSARPSDDGCSCPI